MEKRRNLHGHLKQRRDGKPKATLAGVLQNIASLLEFQLESSIAQFAKKVFLISIFTLNIVEK